MIKSNNQSGVEGDSTSYRTIASAIEYLEMHHREHPSLEDVADYLRLSPYHLQRLFTAFVGISPKKFVQLISVSHAKSMLRSGIESHEQIAFELGMSSPSRLHDLFVTIEAMTPAEFRNEGKNLEIDAGVYESMFGTVTIANTVRGICYVAFNDSVDTVEELEALYPYATISWKQSELQHDALRAIQRNAQPQQMRLHVHGTPFQLQVWQALLRIPETSVTTYGNLARQIDQPRASRAIGNAVGANKVAILIPCHRVIAAGGHIGHFRWGTTRKKIILGSEFAERETTGIVD